jgi:hypothetical protein
VVASWVSEATKGGKANLEKVGVQLLAMRPRVTAGGLRLARVADPSNALFEDEVEWARSLSDRDQEPILPSTFSQAAFSQRAMQCGVSCALKSTIYAMDTADLEIGRLLRSTSPLDGVSSGSGSSNRGAAAAVAGEWTVQIAGVAKLLAEIEREYDALLRFAAVLA